MGVVVLCVASALITRWQAMLSEIDEPVTVITSSVDGTRIDRPQVVAIEVRRRLTNGHKPWLACQNNLGGPVVAER